MNKKEPLFHIVKRDVLPWYKAWGIRAIAIIAALLLCGIITAITLYGKEFSDTCKNIGFFSGLGNFIKGFFGVYGTFVTGAFGSSRKIWVTLQNLSILLIISLALTPAFKMRFWNIGGEGQVLVGALATAACMICLGPILPGWLVIILMLLSSLAAGAIWGLIPAIFKAKWNTNETLATLMMNYIATQLVAFFVIVWEVPKGSFTVGIINQSTQAGWLPQIGNKYLLCVIVAALVTAFMYVYLKYSKHGYEISVVGESEKTAKYVGMKTGKIIVRTMLLSGALCGLAGFLLVGSVNHTITTTINNGQGFTAVMVSWLAKFNPITMIFTSFLLIFMERGAGEISTGYGLNQSFTDILTGIILFFIIGCEFFISYRIVGRKSGKEEK